MLKFQEAIKKAVQSQRIHNQFKQLESENQSDNASFPVSQQNSILSKTIKALICRINKLELKLRLVDDEHINNDEFNKLIMNITYFCDNKKETSEFIDEMRKKNADNKNKEVIDIFNLYLPLFSVLASLAIAYLTTTEITEENIRNSTVTFNLFMLGFLNAIKSSTENSAVGIDLYSKAWDLYSDNIKKTYANITNTTTAISNNIYPFIPKIIKIAANEKRMKRMLNNILKITNPNKKLMLTYTMFSIIIFLIILFIEKTVGFDNHSFEFTPIVPSGVTITGGKKSKKSKKSKNKQTNL